MSIIRLACRGSAEDQWFQVALDARQIPETNWQVQVRYPTIFCSDSADPSPPCDERVGGESRI